MFSFWVERKRVHVKSTSLVKVFLLVRCEIYLVGVGDAKVDPGPDVVRFDLKSSVVGLHRLLGPAKVGKGSSKFIPDRVVVWVRFECLLEKLNALLVSLVNVV